MVARDPIGNVCRCAGRSYNRVQLVFIHYRIDTLGPRKTPTSREGLPVSIVGQGLLGFGFQQFLLAEPLQLLIGVLLIELDNLFESMDRSIWSERCQISVHIGFHLVAQHFDLGVPEVRPFFGVDWINQHCALALHDREH